MTSIINTGDIIVSLISVKKCKEEGDVFIAWKTFPDYVYYQGPELVTPLSRKSDFRLATEKEKAAYLSGIRNIQDIDKPKSEWIKNDIVYFCWDPESEYIMFKSHLRRDINN